MVSRIPERHKTECDAGSITLLDDVFDATPSCAVRWEKPRSIYERRKLMEEATTGRTRTTSGYHANFSLHENLGAGIMTNL